MKEFYDFCRLLASESGQVIKQYFRTGFKVESKSDHSPVTIADKKAEEVMRELIGKEFSTHGILGEEFPDHNPEAEYTWVLDPIDGTKSFVAGVPLFGTLICLLKQGQPLLGVIHNPILEDFLYGDNTRTTLNDREVNVRPCDNLAAALLLTTDHLAFPVYQDAGKFDELTRQVKLYRTWGDCYGYFALATGYADIMLDPAMNRWDTMALIPIIRGAGGVITSYQGLDPVVNFTSTVAASPGIHARVIEILNR